MIDFLLASTLPILGVALTASTAALWKVGALDVDTWSPMTVRDGHLYFDEEDGL